MSLRVCVLYMRFGDTVTRIYRQAKENLDNVILVPYDNQTSSLMK